MGQAFIGDYSNFWSGLKYLSGESIFFHVGESKCFLFGKLGHLFNHSYFLGTMCLW